MRVLGFSTGSISLSNFRDALEKLSHTTANAVELSALREHELAPLIEALPSLPLRQFSYVSIHAPSRFRNCSESDVIRTLDPVLERGLNVILHPDSIRDFSLWKSLGAQICIENMDNRKNFGRTASELCEIFDNLPNASLCFDLGHAWQLDRTMAGAEAILEASAPRLKQVHLSEVDVRGAHKPITIYSMTAFQKVSHLIPSEIPVIIESEVRTRGEINEELIVASRSLDTTALELRQG